MQPDSFAVFIWDERIQHMTENMHVMKESMRKNGIEIHDTVAEIAEHFDLPADVLQETIESYKDGVKCRQDARERKKLTEPLSPRPSMPRVSRARWDIRRAA